MVYFSAIALLRYETGHFATLTELQSLGTAFELRLAARCEIGLEGEFFH